MGMIVRLAMCFQKIFSKFKACMGIVGILAMCFQKGFSRFKHVWEWLPYDNVLPEIIFKVLSMHGHGSHIVNVLAGKEFRFKV